jgi:hypothetical protein
MRPKTLILNKGYFSIVGGKEGSFDSILKDRLKVREPYSCSSLESEA